MEPAVTIALGRALGFSRSYSMGDFEDPHPLRGFKSSEKPKGLKRPHSRRNPCQPQATIFKTKIKEVSATAPPSARNRVFFEWFIRRQ